MTLILFILAVGLSLLLANRGPKRSAAIKALERVKGPSSYPISTTKDRF